MYFYRDSNGNEVDLLVDSGEVTVGIEIKASQTFSSDFIKNLKYFKVNLEANTKFIGSVIYKGNREQNVAGYSLKNFINLSEILKLLV